MNIESKKYRLAQGKFFAEIHPKDLILLHFTAGSTSEGAFQSWVPQQIEIGTPYILDPSGTVHEIFDPKYWAYHLAVTGPMAENHRHDKRSVPIEVVNVGPLKLVGNTLYWWPNDYKTKYCDISETGKYVKTSYRGFDYYASFPDVQKQALIELVKYISTTFSIPIVLPPVEKRGVFDLNFYRNWKGIAAHQNFRPDKVDPGPALDWQILAEQ